MKRLFILALAGAVSTPLILAGTPVQLPDGKTIDAEIKRLDAERKRIFAAPAIAASEAGRLPSDQALSKERARIEAERKRMFDAVETPATAANVFPNVATPAPSAIDLEALAKRYEQKSADRRSDGLMVFASLSMPVHSLKRLIADTAAAGGVVVLRGFRDGSMKATAHAVSALGEGTAAVQVNPNAFVKYRVVAVPSVVLVKAEGAELVDDEGCALPDNYVKLDGDVGLRYALLEVARLSPEFQDMAERYARPLQGRKE